MKAMEGLMNSSVLPMARYKGDVSLGGTTVDCYVLDTSARVMSLRTIVKTLTGNDSGGMAEYLGARAIKPFLDKNLTMAETIDFEIPGAPNGRGVTAEQFIEICSAYVSALEAGQLRTKRQKEIAIKCAVILSNCGKLGLVALIDEATGYQRVRADDELQVKIQAYIAGNMREWERTFPLELNQQCWRLMGHKDKAPYPGGRIFSWLYDELIYQQLDQDVRNHLRENNPNPRFGHNHHQWLTESFGLKKLKSQIDKVIGIAQTCKDLRQLRELVKAHLRQTPGTQIPLDFRSYEKAAE